MKSLLSSLALSGLLLIGCDKYQPTKTEEIKGIIINERFEQGGLFSDSKYRVLVELPNKNRIILTRYSNFTNAPELLDIMYDEGDTIPLIRKEEYSILLGKKVHYDFKLN